MNLDEILTAAGKHRARKRVGRGEGAGTGKTCGRGHKGRGSRSGASRRLIYQGGTNPALARIPKRGFNNANFRTVHQIVHLEDLNGFEDGAVVGPGELAGAGLIEDANKPVKILANGELTRKLTVSVSKVSATAAERIAQAGGTVEQTGK